MSKSTVCKMIINSLADGEGWSTKEQKNIPVKSLSAYCVYDPNPETENGRFFAASPSGSIFLNAANISALEGFEEGDEIFVTITIDRKKAQIEADRAAASIAPTTNSTAPDQQG